MLSPHIWHARYGERALDVRILRLIATVIDYCDPPREGSCGPPPLVWRGEIRISGCRAQGDRLHAGASLGRGSVSQGRVQALPIVKDLDILEHGCFGLGAGAELGLMDALRLERGKEALHGCIIETIAPPAHRLLDAMPLQHRPI